MVACIISRCSDHAFSRARFGEFNMIVRFVFIQRKNNLSIDEFRHHWREVHGPIAAGIGGLRGYAQHDVISAPAGAAYFPGTSLAVDGIASLSFDDISAVAKGFSPQILRALAEDEHKFIDAIELVTTVPQAVIRPTEAHAIKQITILNRRPGLAGNVIPPSWWQERAGFVRSLPGAQGVTHNLLAEQPPHTVSGIAGVEEIYFRTMDDCKAAGTSDAARNLAEHASTFINQSATFYTETHRIVG
jgi:uncharacterized protein (TIGR02118 family)